MHVQWKILWEKMFTNQSSFKLWNWTDLLFFNFYFGYSTVCNLTTVHVVTNKLVSFISLLCWRSFELAFNDISAFFLLSLALTWNILFLFLRNRCVAICDFKNKRETRPSYLSQRLLGLLLGTRKILASWPARLRKHFGSSPLLVSGMTNW